MKKIFTLIFLSLLMSINIHAQSACDKLFEEAVKLQQTITINAQNQAIARLKKAKACYDSAEKQALCQNQIIVCQNVIKYIRSHQEDTPQDSAPKENDGISQIQKDATIVLSNSQIVFEPQGGSEKVKVESKYTDWVIKNQPDWVTVYKSTDNWLLIEALPNNGQARTATITLQHSKKEAVIEIAQDGYKVKNISNIGEVEVTIVTDVLTHRTIDMDKDMGMAKKATYKLSSGSHHIKLEADGYQKQSKMLDVKAGGNNTFVFNMKPKKSSTSK